MDNTLTQIVKDTPNDMELGKKIRELYFEQQAEEKLDKEYLDFWTCELCGEHTHEVDYDYIGSKYNHLQCDLKAENPEEFGDDNNYVYSGDLKDKSID